MNESTEPGAGLSAGADGIISQLAGQLSSLERVSNSLSMARGIIPVAAGTQTWTGIAASAYVLCLRSMEHELATAAMRLDDAITETRRAIATMDGRK